MSGYVSPDHCAGCGGPLVAEGSECMGCVRRKRQWEKDRGVDLEEVQRWTDDDVEEDLEPNTKYPETLPGVTAENVLDLKTWVLDRVGGEGIQVAVIRDHLILSIIGSAFAIVGPDGSVRYPGDVEERISTGWYSAPQLIAAEGAMKKLTALLQQLERGHGKAVEPNKRARAIGSRPAMDTRFGEEIEDPDAIPTEEGRQLDRAMDRYETFHAKKPLRLIELEHELPTSWTCVGDALAVMYRTDKWKPDGTDEDYKHLHDKGDDKPYEIRKGVRLYEPSSGGQQLPVSRPRALALLGYCLGLFVRRDDDGEVYESNPRGCYLFSSPSGDLLVLYSPDKQPDGSDGFLAAMAGGNLRVLKDGIDG